MLPGSILTSSIKTTAYKGALFLMVLASTLCQYQHNDLPEDRRRFSQSEALQTEHPHNQLYQPLQHSIFTGFKSGWYAVFIVLCLLSIMCHVLTFFIDHWKTLHLERSVSETVQSLSLLDDVVNREGILNIYEKMYSLDEQYRYGLFLKCTLYHHQSTGGNHINRKQQKLCTQNKVITIARRRSRLLLNNDQRRIMASANDGKSHLPSTCAFSTDCSFENRLANDGGLVKWHRTPSLSRNHKNDEDSAYRCSCEYMPYARKIFRLYILTLLCLIGVLLLAIGSCLHERNLLSPRKLILVLSCILFALSNLFFLLIIMYHWKNQRAEVTHLLDSVFHIRQSRQYPVSDLKMISRANNALAHSMVVKAGSSFILELVAAFFCFLSSMICAMAFVFYRQLSMPTRDSSPIDSSDPTVRDFTARHLSPKRVALSISPENRVEMTETSKSPEDDIYQTESRKHVRIGKYFEQSMKDGTFSTV